MEGGVHAYSGICPGEVRIVFNGGEVTAGLELGHTCGVTVGGSGKATAWSVMSTTLRRHCQRAIGLLDLAFLARL